MNHNKIGPLERLQQEGIADHCEMCGAGRNALLEAAFDPSGKVKTLCQECRIGSSELLQAKAAKPDSKAVQIHNVVVRVSRREFDCIIAALRLWQEDSAHIADGDGSILALATEHGDALTDAEVDRLIERIN